MNARQFFELVVQMRDAQKSYYRTRSRETLSLSKALESRVDAEIRRIWMHRCAYNNMPCKMLIKNICPDYQPKEKSQLSKII